MVKYKYIGKTINQFGKTVWEIVGNLENMGIGRLITRGIYERYPEPSFFKIIKVIPEAEPLEEKNRIRFNRPLKPNRKVIVWTESVFRGRRLPVLHELYPTTYKPDFRLIPKEEESIWYQRLAECKPEEKIINPFISMPPLLKAIVIEEKKKRGEPVDEDPKMELVIARTYYKTYRLAAEGETPTHTYSYGREPRVSPSLFENIDECRDIFVGKNPWERPSTIKRKKWLD